jgi:hypothetical protein
MSRSTLQLSECNRLSERRSHTHKGSLAKFTDRSVSAHLRGFLSVQGHMILTLFKEGVSVSDPFKQLFSFLATHCG